MLGASLVSRALTLPTHDGFPLRRPATPLVWPSESPWPRHGEGDSAGVSAAEVAFCDDEPWFLDKPPGCLVLPEGRR